MDKDTRNSLLSVLLEPVTTQAFFETYWEQEVLHIARDNTERFAHLLCLQDIESVLSTQRMTLADAQLSGGPSSTSGQEYLDTEGQVVASRLLQGHHEGATLVLSQANKRFAALGQFCRDVQAGLAMRCQTNAYLSPAGQQGFRPHYDSHDVFILQVQGKKHFHFYAGGPDLPANHHRFDAQIHTAGEKQSSVELSAGDVLYIPRGVMHDAVAHADTASLHITLGLFPLTTMDVLQELLLQNETDDRRLRESIPGAADTGDDEAARQRIRQLLAALSDDGHIDAAISALRDDMAVQSSVDCTGALSAAAATQRLLPETTVNACLQRWNDLDDTADRVTLRSAGVVLSFEGERAKTVRKLANGDHLRTSELGSSQDESLALAEVLMRHGLICPVH